MLKPSASRKAPHRSPSPQKTARHSSTTVEVVHPLWLLKAFALSLLVALLCAWLTVCLLFYQGEWQLVLHSSRSIAQTPTALNLPYDPIRFDVAETGQPRLTGWWLPASPASAAASGPALTTPPRYASFTILYLHGGSGSLSDTLPALARLHSAGLNIFAIDYRGFGASDPTHPTESRMAQDTAAALDYLAGTRHIPARSIIPYGEGLGASLAAALAQKHPELPAVILSNPIPDPAAIAAAARPTRLIPVRLLLRDRFDIATALTTLTTPKLLIADEPEPSSQNPHDPSGLRATETLFQHAASPSYSVTLTAANYDADLQTALTRFLDEYLPATPTTLPPIP